MLCPKCHSLLTKGAKYCDICGTRISQEDIQVEEVGSRVKNREKHKKEVRKKTKIIILGGEYQSASEAIVGPLITDFIKNFNVKKLFICYNLSQIIITW